MATISSPRAIGEATTDTSERPLDVDAFHCGWDQDLVRVGGEPTPSAALNVGVPLLALAMLGVAALTAFLAPEPGRGVEPLGIALLLVAGAPWIRWLLHGDDGPTWPFVACALTPVAALGVGHWFKDTMSLGSEVAYPLLAFPGLLLAILGIAVARAAMATGIGVAAYLSFGGPLFAAWFAGDQVAASDVVTWHVVVVLSLVAGYAVRFSYRAAASVTEAREALAWRAAAEERRRVARDVHDVVAHTLAVTMLHITAARMAVNRGAPDVAVNALEEAERQGRSSLADIRRIVRLLRAEEGSAIDAVQPGLADVESLVNGYRVAGLPVDLSLAVAQPPVTASTTAELALYQVLREALTNAARHGQGGATVQLNAGDGDLVLRVDNPIGRETTRLSRGSGLTGMEERIAAAGGTIQAGIRDGRWVVLATVPTGEAA
ncbi:MAG: hypothetical protein H0T72_04655 [Chloroflexia bacterium]|nr:hypothetical protein [Chloroflexia bacterium]